MLSAAEAGDSSRRDQADSEEGAAHGDGQPAPLQ